MLVIQVAVGVLLTPAIVLPSYHVLGRILGEAMRSMDLRMIDVIYHWRSPMLTGLSRVYLGVHYPSDVLAGYIIGAWWLTTALLIGKSTALATASRPQRLGKQNPSALELV